MKALGYFGRLATIAVLVLLGRYALAGEWKLAYYLAGKSDIDLRRGHPAEKLFDAAVVTRFNPAQEQIVAGYADGSICAFESADGKLQFELKKHASKIIRLEFTKDGLYLLSLDQQGDAGIWDLKTRELRKFVSDQRIFSAEFSANGESLAFGYAYQLPTMLRMSDLQPEVRLTAIKDDSLLLPNPSECGWISRSSSHRHLATSARDVDVWDVASGKLVTTLQDVRGEGTICGFEFRSAMRRDFSFAPNGKFLYAYTARGADRQAVTVFSMPEGKKIFEWVAAADDQYLNFKDAVWSPDSTRIAVAIFGKSPSIVIIDVEKKMAVRSLELPLVASHTGFKGESNVGRLAYSPDGKLIAGARMSRLEAVYSPLSAEPSADLIWDASTGEVVAQLKSIAAFDLQFSPDGKSIVSSGIEPAVWKLQDD